MSMLDFVKLKFVILVMTLVIGMMALSASQNYPEVHFSLGGQKFPSNVAFNLEDVGNDENTSLYCVTTFRKCCRHNETGTNHSSGSWKFPNESIVESRIDMKANIVRTRGLSSVILHQLSNESSPTGVYTCDIPDGAGNMTKLFVHLYYKAMPGLNVNIFLNESNGLCSIDGGLVASYYWRVNGSHYYQGLLEEVEIIEFMTVSSQVIFNGNGSQVGTLQCCIRDGMGHVLSGFLQINALTTQNLISNCVNLSENSSREYPQETTSVVMEDSSEDNTQQSTRVIQSILSPSITIIVITAMILLFVIIIIPISLIIFRKSFTKKKENPPIPLQCMNPEESTEDVIVSDNASLNKKQSKNIAAPVYSVVSKNAAKNISEEKTGSIDEEKNEEMVPCYFTINKEGLESKREVRNDLDLYATVDKSAKKKKILHKETTSHPATVN